MSKYHMHNFLCVAILLQNAQFRQRHCTVVFTRSALVNIRRKALGHLMKLIQSRLKYTTQKKEPNQFRNSA